jgi:hypothetical protein
MIEAEELSIWAARAALKSCNENISVLDVSSVEKRLQSGDTFGDALASLGDFQRRKGDFGAEIVGTLLVPLLLEALRDFWSALR